MSYLFIIVIGAVVGFVAGKSIKGSEEGPAIDVAAGAAGALVVVFLVRLVGPAGAAGLVMSALVAAIGAVAFVYAMRRVMKPKAVPVRTARRR